MSEGGTEERDGDRKEQIAILSAFYSSSIFLSRGGSQGRGIDADRSKAI